MLSRNKLVISVLIQAMLIATIVHGQFCPPEEIGALTSPADPGGSLFGNAVGIFGSTLVIGADDEGDRIGQAYVYRFDGIGFVVEAVFAAQGGLPGDNFAGSVATAMDNIVVGAYGTNDLGVESGSAFFYRHNGTNWVQDSWIHAPDGAAGDMFGISAAMQGNTAVVGALGDDDDGVSSGAVYVVKDDGNQWSVTAKLTASDADVYSQFGCDVDTWGNYIIGGAWGDDEKGTFSGAAYVFHRDGNQWLQQAKLLPSDGASHDRFGTSVAMHENAVVVGAYTEGTSGAAYVFRRSAGQWVQEAKIVPTEISPGAEFGVSVDIGEDIILVGARYENENGIYSGATYVFRYVEGDWVEAAKLLPSMGAPGEEFGKDVALAREIALVGASAGPDGEAYVFNLDTAPCTSDVPEEPNQDQFIQNHPNPFNPSTQIMFELQESKSVTLRVFDAKGAKVATLFDGQASGGSTTVRWNGRDQAGRSVPSGVYFYRLEGEGIDFGGRMALIK